MAIICREHKLLFILVPGTGCSVVGRALEAELGGTWLPSHDVRRDGRMVVQRKHNTVAEILDHDLMSPDELSKYLVFATVRNPFDRWVTYYQRYAGEWVDYFGGFAERQLERERDRFDFSQEEYQRRSRERNRRLEQLQRRQRIIRTLGFNLWMKGTLLRWYTKGSESAEEGRLRDYAFPMLYGVDLAMRQEQLEDGLNEVLRIAGVRKFVGLPRKNLTMGKKPYQSYWSWSSRRLAEALIGQDLERFGYEFEGPTSSKPIIGLKPGSTVIYQNASIPG